MQRCRGCGDACLCVCVCVSRIDVRLVSVCVMQTIRRALGTAFALLGLGTIRDDGSPSLCELCAMHDMVSARTYVHASSGSNASPPA